MADYNTLQRRRNMVVGGFVLIAFCAFVWLVFIFGELPIAVSRLRSFQVLVNFPNAPGVQMNTPVRYCGYQIGRVIGISPPFLFKEPDTERRFHQVKVTLAIDRKFEDIPSNIDVLLMKRGLGSAYIEFEFDPDRKITGFLADEAVMQGAMGTTSEFLPKAVQDKIEQLVDAVTALAGNANMIVGDADNQQNIKDTLANIKLAAEQATKALESFKDMSDTGRARIDQTADKADLTLDSVKALSDMSMVQVDEVAGELSGAIADIRRILAKVDEGDGSAAKLLNDGRLYENLLDSSQELSLALEQLKELAAEARDKGIKIKW
ncbi:MAG: MCE family protein [Planctomycetes bacterium]|nr:MCE family protein [Planctomycetota bacterium]